MNPSQTIEEDQSMILINDLERSLRVTLFRTKPTQFKNFNSDYARLRGKAISLVPVS